MQRKNKKRKFNAYVINKSDVYSIMAIIGISIVFLILLVSDAKLFDKHLYMVLNEQIPIIRSSNKDNQDAFEFLSVRTVLAETIPFIQNSIKNNEKKEIEVAEKEISEGQENIVYINPVPENKFPIIETQNISKNLNIKNETTYKPDLNMLVSESLDLNSSEILIVHTHGSESYSMDENNYYSESELNRTTDTNYNVVRVGEELAKELSNYGFKVTHSREINDYPSYNQSYKKTLEIIENNLKLNPNIQIVLDIHRDAVVKNDGTKYKFVSEINGEKVAQIMIVCGTDQAGLTHDTWHKNLKFALKLQRYMEDNFPGLARPLNLRQERFNTHVTNGSMIIEIGTSGNTLNEAVNSTKYLAKTIKEVLERNR